MGIELSQQARESGVLHDGQMHGGRGVSEVRGALQPLPVHRDLVVGEIDPNLEATEEVEKDLPHHESQDPISKERVTAVGEGIRGV